MYKTLILCLALPFAAFAADRQIIGVGAVSNDHNGDTLRQTQIKANANFADLYSRVANVGTNGLPDTANAAAYRAAIGAMPKVDSVAALRALTGASLTNAVQLLGYATPGDGADGVWAWNSSSTATDNTGTVIAPVGMATGRWLRMNNKVFNVRWFGAKGDTVTDDFNAITNAVSAWAANYAGKGEVLYFPPGWYVCNTPIVISKRNATIRGDSTITWIQSNSSRPIFVLGSSYPGFTGTGDGATVAECDNINIEHLGFISFGSADRGTVQVGGLVGTPIIVDPAKEFPVTNINISSCFFEGGPLYMFRAVDSYVRNCIFEGQSYMGIMAFNSARNTVTDNSSYASGGLIYLGQNGTTGAYTNCANFTVANNRSTLSFEGIASIQHCTDSIFTGNTGVALGQNGNQQPDGSGFYVGAGTARLIISHNLIEAAPVGTGVAGLKYGIHISDASPGTIISGNDTSSTNYTSGAISITNPELLAGVDSIGKITVQNGNDNWDLTAGSDRFSISQRGVDYWLTIMRDTGYVGIKDSAPSTTLSVSGGNAQVGINGAVITKSYFQGLAAPDPGLPLTGWGLVYFRTNSGAVEAVVSHSGGKKLVFSDSGTLTVPGYTLVPNNTAMYGRNAADSANIPMIMVDSANEVSIATGGQATVINGPLKIGAAPGITTNVTGGTFTVVNGVITGWTP